jgi:opacity protein-like surface antigen
MKHYSSLIALACIAQGLALSAHEKDCHNKPFYIRAEGGKSYAQKADINVDLTAFDPATEGYDAKLGSAAMFGAGVGYNITNWLSAGFSVAHRSKYEYKKHQTSTSTSTPSPLFNKTRYFELDNTSFFFDMYLNRAGAASYWNWECRNINFAPFIGASIGLAQNNLYNFHSVLDSTVAVGSFTTHPVQTIETSFTKHAFAWQVSVGLDITLYEDVTLGIAYRFFDGGKFESNNYTVNEVAGFGSPTGTPIEVPAWTGKLKAHEVIANFTINF